MKQITKNVEEKNTEDNGNNIHAESVQYKTMHSFIMIVIFMMLGAAIVYGKVPEKEYQNLWCKENNGVTEFILDDRERVDCLTDEYAIEFDFDYKWAEAVGQSLYYAMKTGKKPAIVLILTSPSSEQNLARLRKISKQYGIKVWTMTEGDLP